MSIEITECHNPDDKVETILSHQCGDVLHLPYIRIQLHGFNDEYSTGMMFHQGSVWRPYIDDVIYLTEDSDHTNEDRVKVISELVTTYLMDDIGAVPAFNLAGNEEFANLYIPCVKDVISYFDKVLESLTLNTDTVIDAVDQPKLKDERQLLITPFLLEDNKVPCGVNDVKFTVKISLGK